jgi:hypothetical protein
MGLSVLAVVGALILSACSAGVQGSEGSATSQAEVVENVATTAPPVEPDQATPPGATPAAEASPSAESDTANVPPAPVEEGSPSAAPDTGDGEDAYPVRVLISSIGVDADVIDLGLRKDGTLEVPSDFAQTGWYTGRSVPGNVGPSVVVGHVDSKKGPAVFYRLRDLDAGDTIEIHRSDGMVAMFRVSESELVDKDGFPTDRVYGSTAEPTLRLITCGGSFDRSAGSYRGNLIVFAEHLGTYQSTPDGALTS